MRMGTKCFAKDTREREGGDTREREREVGGRERITS